jgi:hypothetical protein
VQAASRPYALAAAAIAAVSAVVVTPLVARQVPLLVRSMETKLVDADVSNIPINLFDDIMNIPYNELEGGGLATMANSFLDTGTWWVPSSTNLWGIDPGDPTHIALIDNFIPFTAFTEGFTNAQGVYEPGLNYEFAGVLAAELPVSSSCDANTCFPMTPPEVITGSTQFDRDIGFFEAETGMAQNADGQPFSLFSDFFKVPLQDLVTGYNFNPTDDPGVINPGGPVNDAWASLLGWGSSGDPFEGGTGAGNAMPWDGVNFQLNLLQPFQTLLDSLEQTPSTSGLGGTGVEVPTLEGVMHTFENLEAGYIIDFDPYTEGSPACPALCDIPSQFTVPALVNDIYQSDTTNTVLGTWVTDYAINPALVNEPTQPQIDASVALLQTGIYNLTPTELADVDKGLASINPELPILYTNAGYFTDPAYLAYGNSDTEVTTPLDPVYGGYNPMLVGQDFLTLLTNNDTNFNQLSNPDLMWFLADPLTSPDPYNGGVPDGTSPFETLFGAAATAPGAESVAGFDPSVTAFSADLSTLLASLGTTAGSDVVSQALADISAAISADLASVVPQSVLSLF